MSGSNEDAPIDEPLVVQPRPSRCTKTACGKVCLIIVPLLIAYLAWRPIHPPAPDDLHTFGVERATTFANLAGAAYCSKASLEAWSCGTKCVAGVENVHVCAGDKTKAFVAKFEGQGIVSFAGSPDFRSTFQEFLHSPSLVGLAHCDTEHCSVEDSVWHEWAALEKCIEDALVAVGSPVGSKIKVAGHSLGGAVASLGMYVMLKRGFSAAGGWQIDEAYTFGSPRPGNLGFSDAFTGYFGGAKSAFYRVTYHLDPFPHLPPQGNYEYIQLAPEAFFENDFTHCRICSSRESSICSGQYDAIAENWTNLGDHFFYMGVNTSVEGCTGQRAHKASEVVI